MKQIWKWIMHLNAKAFCLIALLLFCATAGWCFYQIQTPLELIKDREGELPKLPEPWTIGILDFVTAQLTDENLSIPLTPFGWTQEGLLGKTIQQLIEEQKIARNPLYGPNRGGQGLAAPKGGAGGQGTPGGPGGTGAPSGPKMITPKISFLGFMQRTDGTKVAMFSDSSDKSTVFYRPGATVHGLEIISAGMQEAQVKYPDGSVGTIAVGKSIELAPEPEKTPAG